MDDSAALGKRKPRECDGSVAALIPGVFSMGFIVFMQLPCLFEVVPLTGNKTECKEYG